MYSFTIVTLPENLQTRRHPRQDKGPRAQEIAKKYNLTLPQINGMIGAPRRSSKIYVSLLEKGYVDKDIPLLVMRPGQEKMRPARSRPEPLTEPSETLTKPLKPLRSL